MVGMTRRAMVRGGAAVVGVLALAPLAAAAQRWQDPDADREREFEAARAALADVPPELVLTDEEICRHYKGSGGDIQKAAAAAGFLAWLSQEHFGTPDRFKIEGVRGDFDAHEWLEAKARGFNWRKIDDRLTLAAARQMFFTRIVAAEVLTPRGVRYFGEQIARHGKVGPLRGAQTIAAAVANLAWLSSDCSASTEPNGWIAAGLVRNDFDPIAWLERQGRAVPA